MPDHSEMNYLAKNLRYLARKSEIKQAALGERLGVQQSTVQRIMSGRPVAATGQPPRHRQLLPLLAGRAGTPGHGERWRPVSAGGFSDATMTQAVELLHMLAELRPDDQRPQGVMASNPGHGQGYLRPRVSEGCCCA
ncbi:hypothetical protein SNK04_013980 [Fusarium graminearum]